ncbi:malonyl-CoA-acyl carrier protein transacylase, mitochondrial [Rhinatrema bivittatum]|uniref:malonyl-CoA-acyl carrier protein transacylase, mitochondrial n=1 Tax=Rhinatrema bivittatum TaxID=194408 RepID=UPI00112841E3|nr:malonyl-CoA-acyl carrier protein transacylase, mitochondrial [Rhinatrema bivittatum]XP_029455955.1 malonyl-CoA-acyl carrier protein transacylase, mitochondrial [Rhinatrema bivittatum]XP_029455956.1 malonyl-CoA-acyl carrier protein transacylase, mitochondrial [Rhinatrema bivittatum]XP_029455957.1 malonyl-CoA-acyl carrier protein transacylase, mitochondrial [Rhinatrema bivittatum]
MRLLSYNKILLLRQLCCCRYPTGLSRGVSARLGSELENVSSCNRNGASRTEKISELLQSTEKAPESPRAIRKCPANSSIVLFPGQGSQFVGMGKGLLKYPAVRAMFAAADKVLGYDLLHLCLNGPQEQLNKTIHCQPAVFVTSLASAEKWSQDESEAIEKCVAAAGFSIGEFAALVFGGAMDFTEALYAVKIRAEAMQQASEAVPSGMLSVIGQPQTKYSFACLEAREHCKTLGIEKAVCEVASYLFPDGRVIAGHLQALQFLQKNSRKYHFIRTKMLPVSGAFHTSLMEPALEPLAEVLKTINIQKPFISVYSNVDGKKYKHTEHIHRLLVKQLVSPIKWEQTMHAIYERKQGTEFPQTYEVGPGKQLGTILKNCNLKAWKFYRHVDATENDEVQDD